MTDPDELIIDHSYESASGILCTYVYAYGGDREVCDENSSRHVLRGTTLPVAVDPGKTTGIVRLADVAQYARAPLPEAAKRGIVVTLIDAPTDPLGTLAVLSGIYEGKVRRAKDEVSDDERRAAYEAMMATVLSGPLEAIQFTFLIEGVARSITHQMVRNRFSFFAQESLRFAVPDNWADDLPLPPSLAGLSETHSAVEEYRLAMVQAEDSYNRLIEQGVPAEEAREVLPHGITTRIYWTVSLRTLLMEAGKRTCTQAQFPWRSLFGGVAKALRERGGGIGGKDDPFKRWFGGTYVDEEGFRKVIPYDGWQYRLFADAIRPVCYQQGKCGFMAKFDRGCTIRGRVDQNERAGRPSAVWETEGLVWSEEENAEVIIRPINPAEWAADPSAARVYKEEKE